MKIRPLTPETKLKDNEYIIQSQTSGKLVIKIDSQFIHNLTFSFVSCALEQDINKKSVEDFMIDKIETFYNSVEDEIQYVLSSMAMVFCTDKDDFKHIRQNFYKFNNRLEKIIVHLIWRNVQEIMFLEYVKEMDL